MAKKSLLIASDNPKSELACAFERSLRFLFNEKYTIQKASYNESYSQYPDILLILDTNPHDSSYTNGIHFLRKYWARGIRNKEVPSVILFSFNNLQELIRNDWRHFVLCSGGTDLATIPFSSNDITRRIEKNLNKRVTTETIMDYLKKSCELKLGAIIEHARRNYVGPYSLLIGAFYVNEINDKTFKGVLNNLGSKEVKDEIEIYHSTIGGEIEIGDIGTSEEQPLSEIVKGKKILLIDDECKTAGWEETLNAIFGDDVLKAIGENEKERRWQSTNDILNDPNVIAEITPDNHLNKYDLILLDLYLTADDEKKRSGDSSQQTSIYSGLQLLEAIRKKDPTVPVILFTASNKAFNVKAAEDFGIDGYFQKEGRYHNKEEAERYYRDFKGLIEKNTSQERRILRNIWSGIEAFKKDPSIIDEDKKSEAIQLLKAGLSSLTGYFKEKNPSYLIGVLILLENIIELFWEKRKENSYIYSPSSMNININRNQVTDIKPIYAFITRQLRHSAAHHIDIRYTDAIFAFFAIFEALGICLNAFWKDPLPGWHLERYVNKMINSICKKDCPVKPKCSVGSSYSCIPDRADIFKKAMFLTLANNQATAESRESQTLFRYLFFVICMKKINARIPPFFLNLIKERLCKGDEKEFYPPFKDNCWVGIKMDDGTIDSPLGILKPEMFSDMFEEKEKEGNKVPFLPTEKYLRG